MQDELLTFWRSVHGIFLHPQDRTGMGVYLFFCCCRFFHSLTVTGPISVFLCCWMILLGVDKNDEHDEHDVIFDTYTIITARGCVCTNQRICGGKNVVYDIVYDRNLLCYRWTYILMDEKNTLCKQNPFRMRWWSSSITCYIAILLMAILTLVNFKSMSIITLHRFPLIFSIEYKQKINLGFTDRKTHADSLDPLNHTGWSRRGINYFKNIRKIPIVFHSFHWLMRDRMCNR